MTILQKRWLVALPCIALFLGLVLSACAGGVSQADFDALKQQLAAKEKDAAALRDQLQAAQAKAQQVASLQDQLAAKDKDLAAAKGAQQNAVWFVKPNAPPRPAPTPLPPGTTPPAPPTPPPVQAVAVAFYVDTVTAGPGESSFKVDPSLNCLRTNAFKRGMHVVWRMRMVDSSGKVLRADDVQSAVAKLPGGVEKKFGFGRHGPNADSPWFWTSSWNIPPDFALGTVNYTIEVTTKDGKTGTFNELPVNGSQLMVIE